MDWCRLHTSFYLDPGILGAGEAAEILFLRCIAYSGAVESRGRVPRHVIPILARTKSAARLKALIQHGLLIEDGDDLLIRSWERWQEALDVESDRRKRDRDRKRAEREAARLSALPVLGQSTDTSTDSPRTVHPVISRKEVEVEEERKEAAPAAPPRTDVEGLCRYFVAALARNDVTATITEKWRTEARLLLDRDHREPTEIRAVIDWATQHEFWRANVLSVPKLRSKYDQLRLQMTAGRPALAEGDNREYLREWR